MFTLIKSLPNRRNVNDLTNAEKLAYVTAVKAIKSSGIYDLYTLMHVSAMSTETPPGTPTSTRNAAHRGPAFTPWHREFLIRLEQHLRDVDDSIAIPYWDWANDSDPTTADVWQDDFLGGNGDSGDGFKVKTGPFREGEWEAIDDTGSSMGALIREFDDSDGSGLPNQSDIDTLMTNTEYDESPWDRYSSGGFRCELEGWIGSSRLHNGVHVWVGGDMLPGTSPNDPVFYIHHCFVDKLWADWQLDVGAGYLPLSGGPAGHNAGDAMTPWPTTPNDVLDHLEHYMYDTDDPIIDLDTSAVEFIDIPEGETTYRAIVFKVQTNRDLMFEVQAGLGSDFGTLNDVEVANVGRGAAIGEVRLWVSYTGTTDLDSASDSITIRENITGEEWTLMITANTVSRPSAAIVLALDQSGSMANDSGITGLSRIDVLRYSATPLVNLIQEGNAIGLVNFDHDAYELMPLTGPLPAASAFEPTRLAANNLISSHTVNPAGYTSIGDALEKSQELLSGSSYDVNAVVVLTDGYETAEKYIDEVAGSINSRVYAIGLGTSEQVRADTLSNIANGTDGYMFVSGEMNDDHYFRLTKYYLQILAGVTNNVIVTDPEGWLSAGEKHKIPFTLNESDISTDVILLTPAPMAIKFSLETPDGDIIDTGIASTSSAVNYVVGLSSAYYRVTLPVPIGSSGAREGKWHAILEIDKAHYGKYLRSLEKYPEQMNRVKTHGMRYSLNVHAYSNLRLKVNVSQDSYEPGAQAFLTATLSEYGMPMAGVKSVIAEIICPDNNVLEIDFEKVGTGIFEADFIAAQTGVYQCRVLASGKTLRGRAFTREESYTVPIWKGGDTPTRPNPNGGDGSSSGGSNKKKCWCKLMTCLLQNDNFISYLKKQGLDAAQIMKCVNECCSDKKSRTNPKLDVEKLTEDQVLLRQAVLEFLKKIQDQK